MIRVWGEEKQEIRKAYLYSARNFRWNSLNLFSMIFNLSGCGRIVVLKNDQVN
jgi:hypothetical protein